MAWIEDLTSPLREIWTWLVNSLAQSFPKIIAALAILLLGWIIAVFCGKILRRGLQQVKLDKRADVRGIKKALFDISLEKATGDILKYYIFLLFLREAVVKVEMTALADFFSAIITLIPTWFVGAGMIVISLVLAHWFREKISISKFVFGSVIGNVIYGLILYFGIVLALPKFGFTDITILNDAFRFVVGGLSAGAAIAIGLGFGLALKEPAKKLIHKWTKKI